MTQPHPTPEERAREGDKPPARASLLRQVDRAAGEMNPLLIVFTVGLLILDVTCYVGLQAVRAQNLHAPAAATVSVNHP